MKKHSLLINLLHFLVFLSVCLSFYKSANATPVVGAITGSGEVSRLGNATYSFHLDVPTGINHFAPDISINYRSKRSNHLLGLGWRLNSYASISRCAALQYQDGFSSPVNFDNDRFCLNGKKLVVITGEYGAVGATYRPENNPDIRVESISGTDGSPDAWTVYYPDGRVGEFGSTLDATILRGHDTVLWAANKITRFGYSIETSFVNDDEQGTFYPKEITYLNSKIVFNYSERPDIVSQYIAGGEQKISHRLVGVAIYQGDTRLYDYRFSYHQSQLNDESLLESVKKCFVTTCTPETTFTYQETPPEFDNGYSREKVDISTEEPMIELSQLDLNGDGYLDLLKIVDGNDGAKAYAFLNNRAGQFDKVSTQSKIGGSGTDKQYYTIDVNGDGRKDILEVANYHSTIRLTVSVNNGDGSFTRQSSSNLGTWHNKLSIRSWDYDGDGYTDLFVQSSLLIADRYSLPLLWKNEGDGNFSTVSGLSIEDSDFGLSPNSPIVMHSLVDIDGDKDLDIVSLTKNGIYLNLFTGVGVDGVPQYTSRVADISTYPHSYLYYWYFTHTFLTLDVNNDGLSDIVIIRKSDRTHAHPFAIAEVLLNQGNYSFSKFGKFSSSLGKWANFSHYRVEDINMDGRPDIVRTFLGQVSYIYNQSGGLFSTERTEKLSVTSLGEAQKHYSFDANGDGIADHLSVNSSGNQAVIETSDELTTFSNQLIGVKNGFGYQESFEYQIFRETGINKELPVLPFARLSKAKSFVVTKHSRSDGIGGERSFVYRYSGRMYADNGYGDLGFAKRTVLDETNHILTETHYSQDWKNRRVGRITAITVTEGEKTIYKRFRTYTTHVRDGLYLNHLVRQSNFNFLKGSTTISEYKYQPSDSDFYDVLASKTRCVSDAIPNEPTESITCDLLSSTVHVSTIKNEFYSSNYVKNHSPKLKKKVITNEVFGDTLPYQTQQESRTQIFDYDQATGLIVSTTIEPELPTLSLKTTYTYNSFGQLINRRVKGKVISGSTQYTYATTAPYQLLSSTNEMGHLIRYSYEDQYHPSRVTQMISPNNLVTSYQYDEAGHLIQTTTRNKVSTALFEWCLSCDSVDFSVYKITHRSLTEPLLTTYYDMFGRKLETRQEALNTYGNTDTKKEVYVYNSAGQLVQQSRPYFSNENPNFIQRTYDNFGRLTYEESPDGIQKTYQYAGKLLHTVSTDGTTTDIILNALGQMARIEHRNKGMGVYYQYDAFGNIVRLTNTDGNEIKIGYDIRGNRTILDDPDLGIWHFAYYSNGLLKYKIDAKGQKIGFIYDPLGRKITQYFNSKGSSWEYDKCPNGIGKLCRKESDNFLEEYTYSPSGNLAEKKTLINSEKFVHKYAFDQYDRLEEITYPTGYQIQYDYHQVLGFIQSIRHGSDVLWKLSGMNASGLVTASSRKNGTIEQHRIYSSETGSLQQLQSSFNGGVLTDYSYDWATNGNLMSRMEAQGNVAEDFSYDNADRLNMYHATIKGNTLPGSFSDEFNYSSLLIKQVLQGVNEKVVDYQFIYGDYNNAVCKNRVSNTPMRSLHAITAVSGSGKLAGVFCYDSNGNTISDPLRSYRYDAYNRVTQIRFNYVADSRYRSVTDLKYGPDGQRYQKKVSSFSVPDKTTYYVGNYEKEVIDGTVYHRIRIGQSSVIYQKGNQPAGIYYTLRDGQGSLAALISPTGNVSRFYYSPYGQRQFTGVSGEASGLFEKAYYQVTHRGFTNQEHLEAAELIHMNGRVYDPLYARFLSPDPFIHDLTNPNNYNRYSYVLFNPLRFIDPSGYQAVENPGPAPAAAGENPGPAPAAAGENPGSAPAAAGENPAPAPAESAENTESETEDEDQLMVHDRTPPQLTPVDETRIPLGSDYVYEYYAVKESSDEQNDESNEGSCNDLSGAYCPVSGEYYTKDGQRVSVEVNSYNSLLTSEDGLTSYGFDYHTGLLVHPMSTGATFSVCPECYFIGTSVANSFGRAVRTWGGVTKGGSVLANASSSAFKAADNVAAWTPKNKHLLDSTAKRAARFNTNSVDDVQSTVAEALRSPNAKFMTNNVDDSFRVVTDLGREIGSKGQTSVRVIVGNDGKIWNAFPVNAQ